MVCNIVVKTNRLRKQYLGIVHEEYKFLVININKITFIINM